MEFSENELAGARMETIARRTGFNKAGAYRYFGDEDGLFRGSLGAKFQRRSQRNRQRSEGDLYESANSRIRETLRDSDIVRLLLREAPSNGESRPCPRGDAQRGLPRGDWGMGKVTA